jgi:hypothetical protein
MDRLTLFGLFAVTSMLVCYALEHRGRRYILAFAFSCGLGSAYGFYKARGRLGWLKQFGPSLRCGDGERPDFARGPTIGAFVQARAPPALYLYVRRGTSLAPAVGKRALPRTAV